MIVYDEETFHLEICLVAIEPVSDFALQEQNAAKHITAALEAGCTGLAVELNQRTAHEAKALRGRPEADLGALHSGPMSRPAQGLQRHRLGTAPRVVCRAEARVVAAQPQWEAARAAQQSFETRAPRPLGRPPAFSIHIHAVLGAQVQAQAELTRAQERLTEARALVRDFGALYQPRDPQTGFAPPAELVAARFSPVALRSKGLAEAAGLPERSHERLANPERLTVQWLAPARVLFRRHDLQRRGL